jgi:hypothetical protein
VKNNRESSTSDGTTAQPRFHQRAAEIQAYGTVNRLLSIELEETVRLEITAQLNQLLADTMTLRDLYKKSHWQVAGPTFHQSHLLFEKHFDEQVELVDSIAERYNSSAASASPWPTTLPRLRASSVRLAAVRRCRYSFPDCWTHTR